MYNGKLNKSYLSTKVRLYKNRKPKSSVSLLPDPNSIIKELKHVHLRCCVCLNALEAALYVLNVVFYG